MRKHASAPKLGAPPGTVANFINPPDQMKGVVALHTTCLVIVTLAVTLRIYTRKVIIRRLGIDDYLIMAGWCIGIAYSGLNIQAVSKGMSRHQWDFDLLHSAASFEPFNIGFWIYLIYAAAVKLACLFFYRTIFLTSHKTLIFVNTGIVVVSLVYTTIFFLQIFRCRPIEMVWDWKVDGTCRKSGVEAYSSGVVNAVTDIYVLIVPIPAVWALPLNRCRRIRVISVFCLGLAACAMSIVRLFMIRTLYESRDFTWTITKITTWSVIEINTGLLCACLLVLPAFLKHHWPQNHNTGRYTPSNHNRGSEEVFATVNTEIKTRMETMEWSRKNRSDEVNLTTNVSETGSFDHDVEPARFNTSRPLSPLSVIAEPSPAYVANNQSQSWQEQRQSPIMGPMGGLRSSYDKDVEPTWFNTSRPLSPEMEMVRPAYVAHNESET